MIDLNDKQLAEYYHRSYQSVDGLWCMKVEEKHGFDEALAVDGEVWKVMAKIQARKIKSMSSYDKGIEALMECFTTKLHLDGFQFTTEKSGDGNGFIITISKCPWYDLILKADRQHISARVGNRICNIEYQAWADEFDSGIRFEIEKQMCDDSELCVLRFSYKR